MGQDEINRDLKHRRSITLSESGQIVQVISSLLAVWDLAK